jgi:hypothetical protein
MTVNLAEFVGKKVNVVTTQKGRINYIKVYKSSCTEFDLFNREIDLFHLEGLGDFYYKNGTPCTLAGNRIISIELAKPMNQKKQLIQEISNLEEQLNKAKEQLNNYKIKPEEAEIGDVLEDGSHVFLKGDNFIMVTADPDFDVLCQYDDSMVNYFASEVWNTRSIAGWFLPDGNLMKRAMLVLPASFRNAYYWSSSKSQFDPDCQACLWINGVALRSDLRQSGIFYMRAFKVIHF